MVARDGMEPPTPAFQGSAHPSYFEFKEDPSRYLPTLTEKQIA
jgi:hypothetical protein